MGAPLLRQVLEVALTVRVFQLVVVLSGRVSLDQHAVFLVLLLGLVGGHGRVGVDFAEFLVGGHASVLTHVEVFGVVVLGRTLLLVLLGQQILVGDVAAVHKLIAVQAVVLIGLVVHDELSGAEHIVPVLLRIVRLRIVR